MLLTIAEVAARLKISRSLVYALVARGELACHRIASCVRVTEADLDDYLLRQRHALPQRPRSTGRHF